MLEGRTCFASSSTCAIGATQTANDFCLGCAALSGLVSRTCSGADAKHLTGRDLLADYYKSDPINDSVLASTVCPSSTAERC